MTTTTQAPSRTAAATAARLANKAARDRAAEQHIETPAAPQLTGGDQSAFDAVARGETETPGYMTGAEMAALEDAERGKQPYPEDKGIGEQKRPIEETLSAAEVVRAAIEEDRGSAAEAIAAANPKIETAREASDRLCRERDMALALKMNDGKLPEPPPADAEPEPITAIGLLGTGGPVKAPIEPILFAPLGAGPQSVESDTHLGRPIADTVILAMIEPSKAQAFRSLFKSTGYDVVEVICYGERLPVVAIGKPHYKALFVQDYAPSHGGTLNRDSYHHWVEQLRLLTRGAFTAF